MPFSRGNEILREHANRCRLAGHPLYVLDNDAVIIDGIRVIGSTLWMDMELHNNAAEMKMKAKYLMNDYRKILWDVGKSLTPEHTIRRHKESVTYLEKTLAEDFDALTLFGSSGEYHQQKISHGLPEKAIRFNFFQFAILGKIRRISRVFEGLPLSADSEYGKF